MLKTKQTNTVVNNAKTSTEYLYESD